MTTDSYTHDPERAALLQHREYLENARQTTSRDRDKLVLTIAGGSLTVSLALLERVNPNMGPWQTGLLLAGWLAEVTAIVLVLWSLSSSERALESERGRVDLMLSTADAKDPDWPNVARVQTENLNSWASLSTVVGVALMLIQAAIGIGLLRP